MVKFVSIVVPVRNEEQNVPIMVERLRLTLERLPLDYEVLFVDDGSDDGTFRAIQEESARDSRVTGLSFRRNFGQTTAMRAGFDHARGDVCISLDGDMQHDPSYLPTLIDKIEEGYDLVCTYREGRRDAVFRRLPSKLANWLARQVSSVKVRDFGSTYRAYRREVIEEIPIFGEMHRFIPVFVSMVSNRIAEVPIKLSPRLHGRSKYGIGRTSRVLSDLVVLLFFSKFFNRPIHIFGYIAFALGFPGALLMTAIVARKLAWGMPIMANGPLFILSALLSLVGVQLFTTGIVCEYLVRILYKGGRSRPYSILESTPSLMHR